MSRKIILASFAEEHDLLAAVRAIQTSGWEIDDIYTPYVVHGLDQLLNWRRSRLPVACFLCGAIGVALALWFQFWTTAWDWPLNVGGRPWNSLPAFVPATFETMVLLGGLGVVFAWLVRSGLYPGKTAVLPLAGSTDDRFVVAVCDPGSTVAPGTVQRLFDACHAVSLEERNEEELR
jgi:hypothetical protein